MADDDSEGNVVDRLHRRGSVESEFICGCCSDLLIQPTTLTCGHSFCRLCLAQWFVQSRKKTCPFCQQAYEGCPSVNIAIKNIIEKSYRDKLREREAEISNPENENLIQTLEQDTRASPHDPQRNDQNENLWARHFCSGICVMGALILVIYVLMYWINSGSDLLIHKPPNRWSTDDVAQWLSDLGSWTADYQKMARLNTIDGRLLLAVDNVSLESSFNVTNDLHVKAIYNAIQQLKEFNKKLPASLWEYKAMNPGRSLFLMYGIKDFPRALMLYMYLFQYDEVFVPFLQSTYPEDTDMPRVHMFDDPSRRQEIEFLSTYAVLPYWVVSKFCWSWLDAHFWISIIMFFNCATLTFIEAKALKKFFPIRKEYCKAGLQGYGKSILSLVIFVVVWPLVPSLVCDFLFYSVLIFAPYHNVREIIKSFR